MKLFGCYKCHNAYIERGGASLGSGYGFWLDFNRTNLHICLGQGKNNCLNPHTSSNICPPKMQICRDWALRMGAIVWGVQGDLREGAT